MANQGRHLPTICHLLPRILPIDTTCRSLRTAQRHRNVTDHDDRRRRRARTGRRDDDKRETKGRRHPPGYIPDALWPAKPRPRTSHPRGFPSCLHSRAPSLSSSFSLASTCSTLDSTDVTLFTLWFTCRNIIPKRVTFNKAIKTATM